MPLQFFGRGSAFADEHNSAFFIQNNELIILDCPSSTFQKVKRMDWSKYDNIYILITHTHGDHAGGVGMMLQFVWFASSMKKRATIVAPSEEIMNDLIILLNRIEGCEPEWYDITTASRLNKPWLIRSIPTKHTLPLDGRCFGYQLLVDDTNIIYTGDTATLDPFIPILTKGSVLYTEASTFKSEVHLYLSDILPTLNKLVDNGIDVYLMHLDREKIINEMIDGTEIKLAPLYKPD